MKELWMPVVILFVIITGVRLATAQKPSDRVSSEWILPSMRSCLPTPNWKS